MCVCVCVCVCVCERIDQTVDPQNKNYHGEKPTVLNDLDLLWNISVHSSMEMNPIIPDFGDATVAWFLEWSSKRSFTVLVSFLFF